MSGTGGVSGPRPADPATHEVAEPGRPADASQASQAAFQAPPSSARAAPTSSAWAIRAALAAAQQAPAGEGKPLPHPLRLKAPPAAPSRAETLPPLKLGARGPDVQHAQERLNDFRARLGWKPLGQDGAYGPKTREGIQQLQRLWGLPADGVVGPRTWRRLLAEPNPAPMTPVPGTITAKVLAHKEAILDASARTGVPPAIVAGMIEKESGGRADAVGMRGERGVLQLSPEAHPDFFRRADWKDARASIDFGVTVLRDELRAWNGEVDKALAAVNAGAPAVRKGLREGKTLDEIATRPHYVANVLKYAERYHDYF